MIKAVFFDLDGTLCDSDSAWDLAVKETFQVFHKKAMNISNNALLNGWETVHEKLFQRLDAGRCSMAEVRDSRFHCLFNELNLPSSELPDELNDFLSTRYISNLKLYDDAAVLDEITTLHVGIITNGAHDKNTDSQLSKVNQLGLRERIQSLTISDEIGVRKPHSKIFKLACEKAGVLLTESIMVGDSIGNDIVGANRVNMTSIHINRNSDTSLPDITDGQPDYSVSNLFDILPYLTIK
ncbi:HAD family hydrolase [Candidatus Poribacteria bacterium]|nr:HAD family hydrolase [Candidatus Poribacteria bacterium]